MAWQEIETEQVEENINYEEIYLRCCSEFPIYFGNLINSQYLDEHAGIEVAHSCPQVEAQFQKLMDLAPPPHVEGVDLKIGKDSDKIGGTVIAIHQYLSPKFLAYYTVDHDASCAYMSDLRSSHKN